MTTEQIVALLKTQANPVNVAGMARFGINPASTLGIAIPFLRTLARQIKKDHALALQLWGSGIHEARILAGYIADPKQLTVAAMEAWVADFDSWDVCDQVCRELFDRTPYAFAKAVEWSARPQEFVKRAGFVLMAGLAVHDKKSNDEAFMPFFAIILREATDPRNFVKKAVNWALRQIGKRNLMLRELALACAGQIAAIPDAGARWIAADAIKELNADAQIARMQKKHQPACKKK